MLKHSGHVKPNIIFYLKNTVKLLIYGPGYPYCILYSVDRLILETAVHSTSQNIFQGPMQSEQSCQMVLIYITQF